MCTLDLPRSARLYTEVLGFANGGGRPLWGARFGQIQALPTGDDSTAVVWWHVGRQDFVQVELFTHTAPVPRQRTEAWRPCDLGWSRWGVAVADFDATLARLSGAGLQTITEPAESGGVLRGCFREPGADVIIEIMQDGPNFPGGQLARHYDLAPAVSYVALSVADLDRARAVFVGAAGMTELAPDTLHRPVDEALWELPDARCERAVFRGAGDVLLEVSRYRSPEPAPIPDDHLLSDQGFMNVAVGYRQRHDMIATFDAALAAGATANHPPPDVAGGTYLTLDDGISLELLVGPREMDTELGFEPLPRFPRPLVWQSDLGA
jgi:catechol 2,3-dioxygenase-like lactoylglutathione lyase family enzyme